MGRIGQSLIEKIQGLDSSIETKPIAEQTFEEIKEDRLYFLIESEARERFSKNRRLTYEERKFVLKYLGSKISQDCKAAHETYRLILSQESTGAPNEHGLLNKALALATKAEDRAKLANWVYTGDRPVKTWRKIKRMLNRTHNLTKSIEFYTEFPEQHELATYFESLMYRKGHILNLRSERQPFHDKARVEYGNRWYGWNSSYARPWDSSENLLAQIEKIIPGLSKKLSNRTNTRIRSRPYGPYGPSSPN